VAGHTQHRPIPSLSLAGSPRNPDPANENGLRSWISLKFSLNGGGGCGISKILISRGRHWEYYPLLQEMPA
jgi:hypothetical protein